MGRAGNDDDSLLVLTAAFRDHRLAALMVPLALIELAASWIGAITPLHAEAGGMLTDGRLSRTGERKSGRLTGGASPRRGGIIVLPLRFREQEHIAAGHPDFRRDGHQREQADRNESERDVTGEDNAAFHGDFLGV